MKRINCLLLAVTLLVTGLALTLAGCSSPTDDKNEPKYNEITINLQKVGDSYDYFPYIITRLHYNLYQMNTMPVLNGDSSGATRDGNLGGSGVSMFMLLGKQKALLIDWGNNYTYGAASDGIPPEATYVEELTGKSASTIFMTMIKSLAEGREIVAAATHAHVDHIGMSESLADNGIKMWIGAGENADLVDTVMTYCPTYNPGNALYDSSKPALSGFVETIDHGTTFFDLGGGVFVDTQRVRGHSNGGVIFLERRYALVFTGDAYASGLGLSVSNTAFFNVLEPDTKDLVDFIMENYSPIQRAQMKVLTGHSWHLGTNSVEANGDNARLAQLGLAIPVFDGLWMEWRFIQDMNLLLQGLKNGDYNDPFSGVLYRGENMGTAFNRHGWVYGTAFIKTNNTSVVTDWSGIPFVPRVWP